jgi:hypothetical protein
MHTHSILLMSNESADSAAKKWLGGRGHFSMVGTWASTSAQLQYLGPDGSTWVDVQVLDSAGALTSVALTANGGFAFDLPPTDLRVNLTGGTGSGFYALAARVPS